MRRILRRLHSPNYPMGALLERERRKEYLGIFSRKVPNLLPVGVLPRNELRGNPNQTNDPCQHISLYRPSRSFVNHTPGPTMMVPGRRR